MKKKKKHENNNSKGNVILNASERNSPSMQTPLANRRMQCPSSHEKYGRQRTVAHLYAKKTNNLYKNKQNKNKQNKNKQNKTEQNRTDNNNTKQKNFNTSSTRCSHLETV